MAEIDIAEEIGLLEWESGRAPRKKKLLEFIGENNISPGEAVSLLTE